MVTTLLPRCPPRLDCGNGALGLALQSNIHIANHGPGRNMTETSALSHPNMAYPVPQMCCY